MLEEENDRDEAVVVMPNCMRLRDERGAELSNL